MKPKKLSKKLIVQKETIANLEERQLDVVKGGTGLNTLGCDTTRDPYVMCFQCDI